jgi:formylglycine-generating enzyme required for sulfatase activity
LLPLNCVTWYIAQAFCIWDGGRLPTEAEWNFAAAGGSEQRLYPWTKPGDTPVLEATYAGFGAGAVIEAVGSYPAGAGRWGHFDLVGNVDEMARDAYGDPYPSNACADCANVTDDDTAIVRGGGAHEVQEIANTCDREGNAREFKGNHGGFRCVKSL